MENHLDSLVRIYRNDFFLTKIRERLNPPLEIILRKIHETKNGNVRKNKKSKIRVSFEKWLSSKLPSYSKETEAAHDIFHQLLLSENFVYSIVQKRPYFAIELLNRPFHEKYDFLNLYIAALLSDTSSILYYEIQNNQNISSSQRYYISESNRFLHYLLKDAKVGKKLSVWKPFGDYSLSFLDSQARNPDNNQ